MPQHFTMAGRDQQSGPSGGTGFLFGNIDKKGRLDEEYLSDDAKDTIDNVGAKVVNENDRQLREIEALPLKSSAPAEEDYDASDGVDYFDEDEELDEETRTDMAEVALRKAAEEDDEDENYDDDDDEGDDKAKKKSDEPPENSALAEQLRLMAAAREAKSMPEPPPPPRDPDVEIEDDPLPFSRFFTRPAPPLQFKPRPRTYGFMPSSQPVHDVRSDDADLLERRPTVSAVDPAEVVVALDAKNAAMRRPTTRKRREPVEITDREEYLAAAQPLETGFIEKEVNEKGHALVQQVEWEDDIVWGDDGDDEEQWWNEEMEGKGKDGEAKAIDAGNEDDDDDDDEFEDAFVMNVDHPEENVGSVSEQKPSDGNDDVDDDMGWEDVDINGGEKAADARKDPKVENTDPELDDDDDAMDWEDAEPNGTKAGEAPRESAAGVKQESNLKSSKSTGSAEGGEKEEKDANASEKEEKKDDEPPKKLVPTSDIGKSVIAVNRDLAEGTWVHGIAWDSHSESETDERLQKTEAYGMKDLRERFTRLILDMNDPNMVLEHLSDDSKDNNTENSVGHAEEPGRSKLKLSDLIFATGTQVQQLLQADRFNISNDLYYARGASHHLKVDRRDVLRGLQVAPPLSKCQTTKTCIPESELLSFRRPKLVKSKVPDPMVVQPLRRKRPKGGHAQIAGQIPKRKTELNCSEKDAYRVSLYEYPLERQPPIMLVPGMSSRIVTYQRKKSAAEAQKASKDAAGTAEADTIFMAPDEVPPVAAGDIQADEKPLSVLESHILTAPCAKSAPQTTDFLLTTNGKDMYVREIDSIIGVGMTEPKVEVMAPNTERYKRYAKERAHLWIVREFSRQQREIVKAHKKKRENEVVLRNPPYITKEEIWREFFRRRTYPQGSLTKMLKDMANYQNGKYAMPPEPKPGTPREAELLRTLNPVETAAFEAMDAGWEQILNRGIRTYTHPSSQGNILSAADPGKTGLEFGTAVATYFKCHLLKTPWYVTANKIAIQSAQMKELLQVLSLARIVNDLREGGNVMESRLMSLSPAEMNNVLSNHFKLNAKKIPEGIDERRELLRELSQKKSKSTVNDVSNYSHVIANVFKKHRDAGLGKGAAIAAQGTSMIGGTHLGLPLDVQRRALEDGEVEELPIEEEDFYPEKDGETVYAIAKRQLSKRKETRPDNDKGTHKSPVSAQKNSLTDAPRGAVSSSKPPLPHSRVPQQKVVSPSQKSSQPSGDDGKKKKKVTRLKVTKKVLAEDGSSKNVVSYITDPKEIARILEKRNKAKQKKETSDRGPNTSGVKIAIDLKRLTQASKAGSKGKGGAGDKKKAKKGGKKAGEASTPTVRKIAGENGQIGKIKISTKQLHKDREQAALKRKRSQYGDDIDYRAKKTAKTSRRKRNGKVQLNGILERIEKTIRETEGYIVPGSFPIRIARLKNGESPPPNVVPSNLAIPKGTGLDFTAPVDTKTVPTYTQIVKKPMYLNLVRQKCRRQEYNSGSEFVADMQLMASNARLFNSSDDVQWVVQHAQLLLDVAVEQASRRADELQVAEEMLRVEKAEEAKAGNAGTKSKKSKPKCKGKKNPNKKQNSNAVVVIDGPDRQAPGAPSALPDVVDLIDDPPLENQDRDPMRSPAASPDPGASMLDAGITADDIYAIDRPEMPSDGIQESADNLVLDLDDVGGPDGL